jgi:hypothetical protein
MGVLATVLLRRRLWDINAQPKVFHRSLLDALTDPPDGFEYDLYVLHRAGRAGWDLETIPVAFGERLHGESKWSATLVARRRTILRMVRYILHLSLGDR